MLVRLCVSCSIDEDAIPERPLGNVNRCLLGSTEETSNCTRDTSNNERFKRNGSLII